MLGAGTILSFRVNNVQVLEQVAFNHQIECTSRALLLDGKKWLDFLPGDKRCSQILFAKPYWE